MFTFKIHSNSTASPSLFILFVFILLGVHAYTPLSAQTKGVAPVGKKADKAVSGTSRAVVVGISDYRNENITDLKYADRDAIAFTQFLKSPAGGNIPEQNIMLLTNEKATAGEFAAALDWLLETTEEGDQAIIYFSGHGDVERKTITQPGFLLCQDAPSSVYMGGGTFGLYYLQVVVSTLSTQNKANVLVVTDACRAGTLAGTSIGGTQLTAANLARQYASEVKILSCQPDELSLEGLEWGNGRGVFSYYLLQGLKGLADRNKDRVVNLSEIERYLEDKVSEATAPHSQMPMVVGTKGTPVARVDSVVLDALQREMAQGNEPTLAVIESRDMDAALLAGRDSSAFFQYRQFKKAIKSNRLLYPEEGAAYTYYQQLKDQGIMKPFVGLMRRNLAAALQDEAQKAINDYLAADPTEMRKRWTYDNRYEHFPEYLEKAAEVLGEQHYLYKNLKTRAYYFSGLNFRLTGEIKKDSTYYLLGMKQQNRAIELDANAAYAYNELGLLERRLFNYKNAIEHFNNALTHSPMWVLPWVNLAAVYMDMENYDLALTCLHRAEEIDASFPLVQYNLGLTYENLGKSMEAKRYYNKAIKLDPNYALPYYNLGMIYYHEDAELEAAEEVWASYAQLVPNDPEVFDYLGEISIQLGKLDKALNYYEAALDLDPSYHSSRLGIAVYHLKKTEYNKAEKAFAEYHKLEPKDGWGYYFHGLLMAEQQNWDGTIEYLERACDNGFNYKSQFNADFAPHLDAFRQHPGYANFLSKCFPAD